MRPQFDRADLVRAISGVKSYITASTELIRSQPIVPMRGSIADNEINTFPMPELCRSAYSCGMMAMESAADHLMAYPEMVTEPAHTMAPWTCVRGLLEACAIGIWLLEPNITAGERASRQFAYRYEGIIQQQKIAREHGDNGTVAALDARIATLEQQAIAVGLSVIMDRNGGRTGIGQRWPGITDLTEITIGERETYRMLSSIAHCHAWAISQVCFNVVEGVQDPNADEIFVEKTAKPESILLTLKVSITNITKLKVNLWQLFGLNETKLVDMLEREYDAIGFSDQIRFWRT